MTIARAFVLLFAITTTWGVIDAAVRFVRNRPPKTYFLLAEVVFFVTIVFVIAVLQTNALAKTAMIAAWAMTTLLRWLSTTRARAATPP